MRKKSSIEEVVLNPVTPETPETPETYTVLNNFKYRGVTYTKGSPFEKDEYLIEK